MSNLADRADFENLEHSVEMDDLCISLRFLKDSYLVLGTRGNTQVMVKFTGKAVMPVPGDILKEKFGSLETFSRYLEDLENEETVEDREKIENEEYFPHVKACQPDKITLQQLEIMEEGQGRCTFLIQGDTCPFNGEHSFEILIVTEWKSEDTSNQIEQLEQITGLN